MNLDKLKEKTYDSTYPLDDLLIEFREVAKKRENKTFLNWINNELKGYEKNNTPEYRIIVNHALAFMATDGYFKVLKAKASIQALKVVKDIEKEFIEDVTNIKICHSLAEIQEQSLKTKEIYLIPEQAFSYLIDNHLSGGSVQSFHIIVQPGQYKNILNNIRMLLQDFIEDLEKIDNWEKNDLTSILMDKTFTGNITIHQTTNNVTNTMGNGNGNIINSGNDNKLSITYNNNDVINECFNIVNRIQENNKDIENLKLDIITALKDCEKERINSKSKILEKISSVIVTSAAVAADAATAMPLFTTLLNYLRLQ